MKRKVYPGDTFTLAEIDRDTASAALSHWLSLLRDEGGTERMKNRIIAMLIMIRALPPFETEAMKFDGPFPTFGGSDERS